MEGLTNSDVALLADRNRDGMFGGDGSIYVVPRYPDPARRRKRFLR